MHKNSVFNNRSTQNNVDGATCHVVVHTKKYNSCRKKLKKSTVVAENLFVSVFHKRRQKFED